MLDKAKALSGYKLNSLDGEIGKIKDVYFDDQYWTIRYLIADTGTWLTSRQVLISPYALSAVNRREKQIAVNLTRQQIEDSPPLDSDKPVSQQFENYYYGYHGWPNYWGGPYSWGAYPYIDLGKDSLTESNLGGKKWDPHLRSVRHVDGYHVKAKDGEIGHVEDFLIDDKTWAIRYLIIDTQDWLPGKRVLISPQWIENISWTDSSVFVNAPRETIKESPEYINEFSLTRDYETRLHRHYNHRGYWVDEPAVSVAPVLLV